MKKWVQNNYDHISNIGFAILSVPLSMLATYLYGILSSTEKDSIVTQWYIVITLIIFAFLILIVLSVILSKIKKKIFKESNYNRYIQKAYLAIQDYSYESQSYYQEIDNGSLPKWVLHNIQLTVDKCYEFFASSYLSGKILVEETKFEVTFMTRSYKDSKITIPCSCNREKRTPTSMHLRESQPDIYSDTVTAEVYKEYDNHCKPTLKIISNTEPTQGVETYHFIYENQRGRIKSSVVMPVLSHKNELLGTLVVHCDTPNFFEEKQRNYWYEILQLFACEIGKNKLLLDSIYDHNEPPF